MKRDFVLAFNTGGLSTRWTAIVSRYGAPVFLFACGAVMLSLGWRRWADLLVDYGNQLYVPWQISQGEVLYRDLFYVFGPLSSYLHAGIFELFGAGAIYLILFNILLTAVLTFIIYRLIHKLSDKWTATIAALTFLTVHALGQHKYLGNYNFIQPYSYDLTHGMFLSFLALLLMMEYLERPARARLGGIGLLVGLVFMTKIEVALAVGVAALAGFVLAVKAHRLPAGEIGRHIAIGLSAFIIPAALFLVFFSFHMPLMEAFDNLLMPWRLALAPEIHDFFYFRKMKGTAYLAHNLSQIALYTVVFLVLVSSLAAVNHRLNLSRRNGFHFALLIASILVALIVLGFNAIPWRYFLKPLPVILLVLSGWLVYRLKANFRPGDRFYQEAGLLVLAVFALVLTLKIFFRVVLFHYGFALSVPGVLVAIVIILSIIPQGLQRRQGSLYFYRFTASALLLVYVVTMNIESFRYFSKKNFPVGSGPDLIYDYHPMSRMKNGRPYIKGFIVKYALEFVEQEIPQNAEMAVMPDAIMINYLSRRKDPIKGFLLNPVTWVLFGKDQQVLDSLNSNPPPYIMLVDRSYPEFDMSSFGKDYGAGIQNWIQNHYDLIKQFGATPFTLQGFGIQIYQRRDSDGIQ